MESFTETLRSWQNFYFMAGGAAAGLLGLMFVAISMGINFISVETRKNAEAFVSPNVMYFVSALLISGVMLIPTNTPTALAVMLLVGGVFGLGRAGGFVFWLIRIAKANQDFNLGDWLGQIIFPICAYTAILVAALGFLLDQSILAFMSVWLAMILLLVAAISNTWSLVMWIVDKQVR